MMKSILRLSLISVVVLVSLIGSGVWAQDDAPQPVLGAINIIQPELFMTAPGAEEEEYLRGPSVFDVGESLRSDETGMALITWFYDGTESVLGPNSTLTLNNFSGDAKDAFVVDLTLEVGHLVAGMGGIANMSESGAFTVATPAFTVKLLRGQFELTVAEDGATTLVVTEGRVEASVEGGEPVAVDGGQVLTGTAGAALGEAQDFANDGVSVNLTGVCTATAGTNINVRLAPNEDSRRLGGVPGGQVFWVRAGTEGNLWLQVYFQTDVIDEEGHNYGWVYGPAVTLDEAACVDLIRAPLDAQLYGGPGIEAGLGEAGETEVEED